MSKIKIVNENGELVGKDTQTGETVPVKFGSGIATEEMGINWSANTDHKAIEIDYPESGFSGYQLNFETTNFNGTTDPIMEFGWNVAEGPGRIDTNDAAFQWNIEGRFDNGTQIITESYWNFIDLNGNGHRPIITGYYHTDDKININLHSRDGPVRIKRNDKVWYKLFENGAGGTQHSFIADKLDILDVSGNQKFVFGGNNFFINQGANLELSYDSAYRMKDSGDSGKTVLEIDPNDNLEISSTNLGDRVIFNQPVETRSVFSDGDTQWIVNDDTVTADHTTAADAAIRVGDGGGNQWEIPLRAI